MAFCFSLQTSLFGVAPLPLTPLPLIPSSHLPFNPLALLRTTKVGLAGLKTRLRVHTMNVQNITFFRALYHPPSNPKHKLLLGHLIQYVFAHNRVAPVIYGQFSLSQVTASKTESVQSSSPQRIFKLGLPQTWAVQFGQRYFTRLLRFSAVGGDSNSDNSGACPRSGSD